MEWLLENHDIIKEGVDDPDRFITSSDFNPDNPLHKIKQLLQDISNFHQQYFDPNPRAMKNLTEMGFNPDDVFQALRVTNNDQLNAVSNIISCDQFLLYLVVLCS